MSPKDRQAKAPRPLAAITAERIGAIVEAAERAAAAVIDDAEAQARQYLDEAQAQADLIVAERLSSLAELTDSLFTQAEAIGRQSEQLLSSLEEVRKRLEPEAGEDAARREAGSGSRGAHLTAVAAVEEPAGEPDLERRSPKGAPAGARLLATQMAVSGNSRAEIEARLRNGFEIEDTAAILDAILGPED